MFKALVVIIFSISICYYLMEDEEFPAETNHVMGVDLYKDTGLADCAYDGHDCSTVYSILPNGFERAIAGDNKVYLEAMSGLRDSFTFEGNFCEVLQRKEFEFKKNVISTSRLMALRCTPIEEKSSKDSTMTGGAIEPPPAVQSDAAHTEEMPTTQQELGESFWN